MTGEAQDAASELEAQHLVVEPYARGMEMKTKGPLYYWAQGYSIYYLRVNGYTMTVAHLQYSSLNNVGALSYRLVYIYLASSNYRYDMISDI